MPIKSEPWKYFVFGALSVFSLQSVFPHSVEPFDFEEDFKRIGSGSLADDWKNIGLDLDNSINHYVQQEKQGQIG